MALDTRKLELELARIFRSRGGTLTGFHGEVYVGICSTVEGESTVRVPSMPARSEAVSLTVLACELVDAIR